MEENMNLNNSASEEMTQEPVINSVPESEPVVEEVIVEEKVVETPVPEKKKGIIGFIKGLFQ